MDAEVKQLPTDSQEPCPQNHTMMPVKLLEDRYEEMTVEVDVLAMRGSPLDQDSMPSTASDDDDSQHELVIVGAQEETSSEVQLEDQRGNGPIDKVVKTSPIQKVNKQSLVCEICCKQFQKRSRLISHMIVHTEEKVFKCAICDKGFKNKPQLQRHSNTHSAAPNFCCNICGRGFKHNDVAKHIKRFHSGPRKTRRGGVANPNAPNNTEFGVQTLPQPYHLLQQPNYIPISTELHPSLHLASPSVIIQNQFSNKLNQIPPEDNRMFRHKNDDGSQEFGMPQDHQLSQHLDVEMPQLESVGDSCDNMHILSSSQALYGCSDCPQSFTNQSALANHMMSHTNSIENSKRNLNKKCFKRHQCHICLKTFTRASGLTGHLYLHTRTERRRQPNPDFRCHVCGKIFTRRAGLNAHILQHGGVLRFWCDEPECGKGFVHSYQLMRHKRFHSGILPYTCHVCGKSFRHNDLSKHMRTHTGVKPYNCTHCGKAFAFNSSLRTHERMHQALKEHICEICSMGFTTSAGLLRHSKCHEDDRQPQLLCPSCGKLFPSKFHFSLHLQESQLCAGQQHQKLQSPSHTEQLLQQTNVEETQHLQVMSSNHVQQHVLSEIPVHTMAEVQPSNTLPIHVTHQSETHQLPNQEDVRILATLETEPNIITEHAPIMETGNVGTVPVLVPFSVSVPISVPFNINLNPNPSDQMQLNHFVSWEQKYGVNQ